MASGLLLSRGAFPKERKNGLRTKLISLGVFPFLLKLSAAGLCELWETVDIPADDPHRTTCHAPVCRGGGGGSPIIALFA